MPIFPSPAGAGVITADEYVEIAGVALATPAWRCTDMSALYDAPPHRGTDRMVPYHEGLAVRARHLIDASVKSLPMFFYGARSVDGGVHIDARMGLRLNVDSFKRDVLRPRQNSAEGTVLLRHHLLSGEVRSAQCRPRPPLQLGAVSAIGQRGVLDIEIPGGVMRSEVEVDEVSAVVPDGGSLSFLVPNPGTADQFEAVIALSGTAPRVVITNLTWDPNGATQLIFDGTMVGLDLTTPVTVDTAEFRATQADESVLAQISHSGHENWMPLLAGEDNELLIEPVGGTAIVEVIHYPAYQ